MSQLFYISSLRSIALGLTLLVSTMLFCVPVNASSSSSKGSVAVKTVIHQYVSGAEQLGSTRFKYLFWELYDASLYSATRPFSREQPFALKLDYLRNLKGEKIAERSIEEMRQSGFDNESKLTSWLEKMRSIFPDVKKGDFIIGIKNQDGDAVFYKNNEKLGEIDDPVFSKAFFSIWLGEHERAQAFQEELLNQ